MANSTVYVYTMTQTGKIGAWTRYVFPFQIDAFAQLGNDLFVRHGDAISKLNPAAAVDEVIDGVDITPLAFPGRVQWNWLDLGTPGTTKMLEGFDYVGNGQGPSISIGYDQRDVNAFTDPYQLDPDTLPGGIIPLPVAAPTMSVKLDFAGGERWQVQSVTLYVDDWGNGP